ncbi:predicted protein [Aspergillus terreus NIH2624]|uniref:Uncharacterized protein n=1 Tax=Aspergillus terreus (strain NIH 2624 / FGSC A1156) TaxID=341663 RepID=Q0CRJ7_ASPTN|nr:uncharacterized protein ATEG_03687 [Aspergillus terreus NIH2624]EAU35489.1 predicted protein [Aspergillus terreus NIH2624]
MSGLEVTGVVLTILPFLVNQLDNYARGIEKIRMLRRARRHLDSYALAIGTQHTISVDNIQQALEGVVDDEDAMSEPINNLTSDLWNDSGLQDRLRNKLGRSHGIFVQNMIHLHGLLLDLSQRMGIDLNNAAQVTSDLAYNDSA